MQVNTSKIITDRKSVELGITKILQDYTESLLEIRPDKVMEELNSKLKEFDVPTQNYKEYQILSKVISRYNGGGKYHYEITELHSIILNRYYSNSNDTLFQIPCK